MKRSTIAMTVVWGAYILGIVSNELFDRYENLTRPWWLTFVACAVVFYLLLHLANKPGSDE